MLISPPALLADSPALAPPNSPVTDRPPTAALIHLLRKPGRAPFLPAARLRSAMALGVPFFAVLLAAAHLGASGAATQRSAEEGLFVAPEPEDIIRTEGGSVQLWTRDLLALRDSNVSVALVSVEPYSLALPMYSDAQELSFILEGCAFVGLISPLGIPTSVKFVQKGDVLAVPRGWVSWVWNDGDHPLRWIDVADLSGGPRYSAYSVFELIGEQEEQSKEGRGSLKGFSKELLAQAWNVEESVVDELLSGQKGSIFVKVGQQDDSQLRALLHVEGEEGETRVGSWGLFDRFKLSLEASAPDFYVEGAGRMWLATAPGLPILKKIGLSATRFFLERGAQLAPHWHDEGLVIMLVLDGSGTLEISYPNGQNALRYELKAGDFIAVPRNYPSSVVASEQSPLNWIGFVASPRPVSSFLAGRNSVFKGIPMHILEAGFNVGEDVEQQLYEARRGDDELIFFRPRKGA